MPSDFGILMREYRKRKKLSLDDLAVMVDSSKQVLSRYERGERTPKISAAQKIADALDVPLEILIGYEPHDIDPCDFFEANDIPQTPEARSLAKGIDKMPQKQREAIMNLLTGLYPGIFEEGENNDDT